MVGPVLVFRASVPLEKSSPTRCRRGRLQAASEFGQVVVRSNPDGSEVLIGGVDRIEPGVWGRSGQAPRRVPRGAWRRKQG